MLHSDIYCHVAELLKLENYPSYGWRPQPPPPPPPPPPERYFGIAPILWTEITKNSLYICRSVVCNLIPHAWAYRAEKKGGEKEKELEVVLAKFC